MFTAEIKYGTSCAPSVLIYFIDMMLYSDPEEKENCEQYMYEGQKIAQTVFILVALLMIPIMLFGKPIHFVLTHKKKNNTAVSGKFCSEYQNWLRSLGECITFFLSLWILGSSKKKR